MSHITVFQFLCKCWHQIIQEAEVLYQVLLIIQCLLQEEDLLLILVLCKVENCDHVFVC